VFGDEQRDPGSGTRRRFQPRILFTVAVLKRISDTLQELNKVERTAGSTTLYAEIVRALAGERVENITVTRTELTLLPTMHSEVYFSLHDLREKFKEEYRA
jgi:hypothetical protein